MSETRQNCCRLCLAPDSECISILNSYAADKEPLPAKIHNCVSIKITSNDRLSLRICHACISYLNSWQSFKNRCIASQIKQRNWLDADKRQQLLDNNVSISTISSSTSQHQHQQHQHHDDNDEGHSNLASSILDGISSLKKRKSLTVYVSPKQKLQQQQQKEKELKQQEKHNKYLKHLLQQKQQHQQQQLQLQQPQQVKLKQSHQQQKHHHPSLKEKLTKPQQQQQTVAATSFQSDTQQLRLFRRYSYNPLPAVEIKDEPLDADDDYGMKQADESDEMMDATLFLERTEEEGDEMLMDSNNYEYENDRSTIEIAAAAEVKEASCRACNLKFSTRANARRHERNLHPNLFELSTESPNNTLITKPTPALAAALELQRAAAAAAAVEASKMVATSGITPQKYRQEVVNAFNKCETGGYDYENPEKYQDFLTDEKIVFLQQNEEFLQQYQNMTCRCCKKFYATYKNFMAHMRKKYATLPRNLCFNCLKLNDSKALFISHLKRRNCINLYKLLHALMDKSPTFATAVAATAAAAPEKLRTKELLVNKMYECKLCPKQFRLKLEFRTHVYEDHADAQKKDISQRQCSFCGMELDDPAERKRHYNNMDCIVVLRCVTCDAKFDNHQKFLDHVYEKHLAGFGEQQVPQQQLQRVGDSSGDNLMAKKLSFGLAGRPTGELRLHTSASGQPTPKSQYFSRMPQACPICDQQYNNYNNVLRHMESKHPDQLPQTYKCVKCGIGFPRLSNLREHMVTEHVGDKTRHTGFEYIVNADAVKIAYGSTPAVYTGRYDYVMKDLMSITNGGTIADDDGNDNNESAPKKIRLDMPAAANVSANTSSGSGSGGGGGGNMYSGLKECPICSAVFSNNIGLSNHMRSHTAAAQSAAAAANRSTPNSLASAATNTLQQPQTAQEAIFKRNLEQAADRRFRRMRCRICQRRFSSKKSYRFHMLNDHQIRNVQFIKCKLCDAEFAYEKGLKVHMFKIHNTLLKNEMIIKQYECDICSIVYRTEEQLLQHKKNVHGAEDAHAGDFNEHMGGAAGDTSMAAGDLSGISTSATPVGGGSGNRSSMDNTGLSGPLYWYQCKYCPSNFNTNKKLAIHINSHEEFDSNDYSCKDCGNVYSGRKSLWVHRYKKHPQIAEPSECVLCKKVFFDTQMLENHIPTCNRKPITATGAMAETATGGPIYKHKTGDDDDDEVSHDAADEDGVGGSGGITTNTLGGGQLEITPIPASNLKIKLPEVACTICGQRFTDQELFSKHIQMHEMELYTDNPLAAMFDTGPADPNQFYLDRVNDNGEYACDLCTKTFTQMTALKVHRKWHFRGDSKQNQVEADHTANAATTAASASVQTPISHQHLLGLQAVGLMPNPRPSSKSQKRKRELKCEYCPSTFISNNNLRRHIYELHKDEIGNLPEPPKIETDEYLYCRRCNMKFETKLEWIEHKVADARITKPFGPFQWGCELCGAYVSRKEKLINHIHNHMKERVIVPVEQQKPDSQLQQSKQQQQHKRHQSDGGETKVATVQEKQADEDEDEEEEEETKSQNINKAENDDDDDEDDNKEEYDEDAVEYDARDVEEAEDDDGEEDADYEEEDAEEADEMVVNDISKNANDGGENVEDEEEEENGDAEEENGDDAEDDDEEEDDDGMDADEEDGDVEDTNDDETNEAKPPIISKITIKPIRNSNDTTEAEDSPSYAGDDDDDAAASSSDDSDADTDVDTSSEEVKDIDLKTRFSCDLCRLFFDTQQELQKHVKMHFLNGPGSVSLTEIKPKSGNKSRSSSSDIVTVSSS